MYSPSKVIYMQSIRNFLAIAIIFPCFALTFQGFPGALISYLGFVGVLTAWTVFICALVHPHNCSKKYRFGVLLLTVIIFFASSSIINLGGLARINISIFNNNFDIWLNQFGTLLGIFGGIYDVDNSMLFDDDR